MIAPARDGARFEPSDLERLRTFTRKGKMIRGGLVALGCEEGGTGSISLP